MSSSESDPYLHIFITICDVRRDVVAQQDCSNSLYGGESLLLRRGLVVIFEVQ